jgi:hypothetical protein
MYKTTEKKQYEKPKMKVKPLKTPILLLGSVVPIVVE